MLNRLPSLTFVLLMLIAGGCSEKSGENPLQGINFNKEQTSSLRDGSEDEPLRVMLVPADGGTEQGTLADYEPIFNAIHKAYGLYFDIKAGQSYNAVVEAMNAEKIEIAFFGPVTFHQARQRGCAELLAVAVSGGESVYYSGIFARRDSGINEISDLKGKSLAVGDVNSTSSFNVPIAMLLEAGIDPIDDIGKIIMAGSHAYSLDALKTGKVDAACASYTSFEKAVNNGDLNPEDFQPLAKSYPIPYPPLAIHVNLDPDIKQKLKDAFHHIHEQPEVKPDMIRGYGGKKVDRYDADFSPAEFDKVMSKLARVTGELKAAILKKAGTK